MVTTLRFFNAASFKSQLLGEGCFPVQAWRLRQICLLSAEILVAVDELCSLCRSSSSQVPDRFLEVAQVTLREFFNAIVAGKDADPSWKKAIYKVICKLDSEVPEIFKSPNCLQELLHD